MLLGEQDGLAFDVGLGSATATDASIDSCCIESQSATLNQHHPLEVLVISLL